VIAGRFDWSEAYLKLAGCLLLLSGWMIVLVALVLLPGFAVRAAFIGAGIAVEILGLGMIARGQVTEHKQAQALQQSISGTGFGGYR
jgi:hypothetical protein